MEEDAIVGRNEVLAGLLAEANNWGPDANSQSRITAWNSIGKILGMFTIKVENSVQVQGVMAIPLAPSMESWEAASAASQKQLKSAVKQIK
jgi:hypothetical protein